MNRWTRSKAHQKHLKALTPATKDSEEMDVKAVGDVNTTKSTKFFIAIVSFTLPGHVSSSVHVFSLAVFCFHIEACPSHPEERAQHESESKGDDGVEAGPLEW